jgi:DNA-binding PadR family transcriptional regulator
MKTLSRADELVLLSVWRLGENAYGVTIRKHIIQITKHDWSVGAVYDSLERLSEWGYLSTYQADPTPERGGRSKRYYRITKDGVSVLEHTRQVNEEMWNGLPEPGTLLNG